MYTVHNVYDFAKRHDLLDHEIFKVLKHFGHSDNWWVAGGAVRSFIQGKPITTDVDFFFRCSEQFDYFVTYYCGEKTSENENQVTFNREIDGKTYKIQAIKIGYYENPTECIDSFDYTICQCAIHGDKLYVGEYTLWDIARGRLVLHKLTYGVASVRRMIKYASQGFTACQGCIGAVLQAVADDPSVIQSQVAYVD